MGGMSASVVARAAPSLATAHPPSVDRREWRELGTGQEPLDRAVRCG